MIQRTLLVSALTVVVAACGSDTQPKPEARSSATSAASSAVASATATASAHAAPSATAVESAAPAASASAAAEALIAAEAPAAEAPTAEEFSALDKEIAVRASGEQKCSTKVLRGWFELNCGVEEGLVRAKKVEVIAGFDAKTADIAASDEGATLRWVAALPASGERCQARLHGGKLHEIWLTLEHTAAGWKGQLSGKQPE